MCVLTSLQVFSCLYIQNISYYFILCADMLTIIANCMLYMVICNILMWKHWANYKTYCSFSPLLSCSLYTCIQLSLNYWTFTRFIGYVPCMTGCLHTSLLMNHWWWHVYIVWIICVLNLLWWKHDMMNTDK